MSRVGLWGGPAAVLVLLLTAWVPAASAAPPVNDDFGARLVLDQALPIQVAASNTGATKELGEPNHNGYSSAGHSVWYEWVAATTGLVTIGACDSDFRAVVGIYTGTAVGALSSVVSGNASEGPDCPYSSGQFTFRATAGTSYEIAVDGDAFGFPGGPPPVTEGQLSLRIEATPAPANDAFGNAAPLTGSVTEEPDGNRFYFANLTGSNWGATEEEGEPDHAANPGGASVWYAWTPPESGVVQLSVCCGGPDLLGIYTGGGVGMLTPLAAGRGFAEAAVVGGASYRIAVDGAFDGAAGRARMGSFAVRASMRLVPRGALPVLQSISPPALDRTPPRTTISKANVSPLKRMATFVFGSNERGNFNCKLDRGAYTACTSPKTYKGLKAGRHTFRVVARDRAGNKDATPAVERFGIPSPESKQAGA